MTEFTIDTRSAIAFPTVPQAIVAIPVCNEFERIAACLLALADQTGMAENQCGILLFLNNCTDGTLNVVREFVDMPWPMRVVERDDPMASAGWARRIAMDAAASWLEEGAVRNGALLTTDADSCVSRDWVARNLDALSAGADLVAGRIKLDPAEAALLPAGLHERGRLEGKYTSLLTEISARLDPEPGDPWPCHWSRSGATLAVRLPIYRQVGGMPDIPSGEDRAFVEAVRAQDLIVRHEPAIEVITSGRLEGRARGGVADTIRLRCAVPDSPCDERLENLFRVIMRVNWRRRLRRRFAEGTLPDTAQWAPALGIQEPAAHEMARLKTFGRAFAAIEAGSLLQTYRPLRPSQLSGQIRLAVLLVRLLRLRDSLKAVVELVVRRTIAVDETASGPFERYSSVSEPSLAEPGAAGVAAVYPTRKTSSL